MDRTDAEGSADPSETDASGTEGPSTTGAVDDGSESSSGSPELPDDGLWPYGFRYVQVPGVQAHWLEFADFDGDGITDILANGPDGITVHAGDGLGAFEEVSSAAIESHDFARVGDFDGDGDIDALAFADYSGETSRLLVNDGQGALTRGVVRTGGFLDFGVVTAHLDDDSVHDVFTPSGPGGMVAYSQGDGTFAMGPDVMAPSCFFSELGVGDFDGDGLDDVAGTGGCNSPPDFLPLIIYRHLEAGFGHAQGIRAELGPAMEGGDVRVRDIDHDGDLDIMTLTHLGVYVVHNLGDGTFADPPLVVPHTYDEFIQTLIPLELAPDGAPAFLVDSERYDNSLSALVLPAPDLATSTTEVVDLYGRIVGTADLDGDDAPDVAVLVGDPTVATGTLGVWLSGG